MGISKELPTGRRIVFLLFLFSGVSGLIYEVLWTRMFTLVLGTTVYAVTTVLGVFMGGLALGSWIFGRIADRQGINGFRLYAYLEGAIGIYAFLLPFLMDLSDSIYRAAWPVLSDSFAGLCSLRLCLAILILTVPSTLMGGTLPALSRYLVKRAAHSGYQIGNLYAINTIGAIIGCFITGFFLIELLGVQLTLTAAAILNLSVAAIAFRWSSRPQPVVEEATQDSTQKKSKKPLKTESSITKFQINTVLWLFAFSGFSALALEVLWTRSLMYFVNIDTWAFTSMLCAFLCGIGFGSLIMTRFVDKIRRPLFALAIIEVLIGITAAVSIPLFGLLYGTQYAGFFRVLSGNLLLGQIIFKLSNSFLVMLAPTLLMGAAFPLVCRIYVVNRKEIGRETGTLYALNTAGAIVGSAGAGFILLPLFGSIQRSILFSASLYIAIGLILLLIAMNRKSERLPVGVFSLAGLVALILLNIQFSGQPIIKLSHFFKENPGMFTLRYFREGPDASIAVLEKPNGLRELNINGQSTAFTNYMDMQVHRMLSHLPMLLHPNPEKVLVVGFGMGSTVWGCCQYPDVQTVDCVELLRDEKETAPWFEEINYGVLNHPKLNFITGDGRNYILATRELYDVISFNAIHPRYSANLYTVDFYRMCRQKMAPDGIICAWMTQNTLADVEWKMLCRSFIEVFPHSSLWFCNPQHFCLIGSLEPQKYNFDRLQARISLPGVAADLKESNLENPYVFITRYLMGAERLSSYLAGSRLNTDDKPLIEFTRTSIQSERTIILDLVNQKEDILPHIELPIASDSILTDLEAFDRGSRYMMSGQIETWYPTQVFGAEIAYRKALLLCPSNQDVRHNLNFSEQIKSKVQRILEQNPNHPNALFDMGRIAMEEGNFEKAEEYLLHVLDIGRGTPQVAYQLALLYYFQDRMEECTELLQKLIKTIPDIPPIVAFTYYEILLQQDPENERARVARENLKRQFQNIDQAFTLMGETVRFMRKLYLDSHSS